MNRLSQDGTTIWALSPKVEAITTRLSNIIERVLT